MKEAMEVIQNNWVSILAIIAGVIAVASVVVKLTPTEADNKVLDKIIKILQALSLYKK